MCLRPEDKNAGITLLILNSWNEISGPGKLQNYTMSLPKSSAMAISKSETRDLEYNVDFATNGSSRPKASTGEVLCTRICILS